MNEEDKHLIIFNRIGGIEGEVIKLEELVGRVQNGDCPSSEKGNAPELDLPLAEFMIQTPDKLQSLADRLSNIRDTLTNLLF